MDIKEAPLEPIQSIEVVNIKLEIIDDEQGDKHVENDNNADEDMMEIELKQEIKKEPDEQQAAIVSVEKKKDAHKDDIANTTGKNESSEDADEKANSESCEIKMESEDNPSSYYASVIKNAEKVLYEPSVTQHIEIYTLDEEERQLEHKETLKSRQHMNYVCNDCALGFVVESVYLSHMRVHAPEAGKYECELCHVRVKTEDGFNQHKWRHYRRYRCDVCHLVLKERSSIACHVATEHEGLTFSCSICNKTFKRPSSLKGHVEQFHAKTQQFECTICNRKYYEKRSFKSHMRLHNEQARKGTLQVSTCDVCYREFKNKCSLKKHMATHESRADCLVCGVSSKNPQALKVHMRQHEHTYTRKSTAAECTVCGRTCTTRHMLKRHVERMHGPERVKKFECDHCGRMYMTKGEIREHITWSHGGARPTHVCACARVFRTPARLRQHVRAHHLRLPPPRAPRPHACPTCRKQFPTNALMNRHQRIHTDQRYACEECGESFKTQTYVKIHYKLKHMNMTRSQIKRENEEKRRKRIEEITRIHLGNFEKFIALDDNKLTVNRQNNEADPLIISGVNDGDRSDESNGVGIPLFDTFIDVQIDSSLG